MDMRKRAAAIVRTLYANDRTIFDEIIWALEIDSQDLETITDINAGSDSYDRRNLCYVVRILEDSGQDWITIRLDEWTSQIESDCEIVWDFPYDTILDRMIGEPLTNERVRDLLLEMIEDDICHEATRELIEGGTSW